MEETDLNVRGLVRNETGDCSFLALATAFSNQADEPRDTQILVERDMTVCVWDPAAYRFTTCHILPDWQVQRFRQIASSVR